MINEGLKDEMIQWYASAAAGRGVNISIIFLRLVCGQKTSLPFTNDPSKS